MELDGSKQSYEWEKNYKIDSYDKYNSPASENDLDGMMLKIEENIVDRYDVDGIFAWIIETSDSKRWLAIMEKDYDFFSDGNESVAVYGIYMGVATALDNLPALIMLRYVHDGRDYEYKLFTGLYEGLPFNKAQALLRGEEPDSSTSTNPGAFNVAVVEKQIGVTEYKWSNRYSHYIAYVLENNSDYMLEIGMNVLFKNENGKNIGASSKYEAAIEPGTKIVFVMNNDDAFSNCEYALDISQERYYAGVISSLEVDLSTTKDKAIVTVKNNGTIAAEFVEYTVLFFNGDAVVDFGWCALPAIVDTETLQKTE